MNNNLDSIETELNHLNGLAAALRATLQFINTPDCFQQEMYLNSANALLNDVERSVVRAYEGYGSLHNELKESDLSFVRTQNMAR